MLHRRISMHGSAALVVCSLLLPMSRGSAEAPPKDVDLELFERSEVDRNPGCKVVLWQHDRNPAQDKYAYVFDEWLIGQNHVRQQARIKIGGNITVLKRVATGGKTTGYNVFEHQLYRLPEPNEFVILELKLAEKQLGSVVIESGKLTVVMDGKPMFRVAVKGKADCMTPDTAVPLAAGNSNAGASGKASSASPRAAMAACLEAAKLTDIPTSFECDWKKVARSAGAATLSGEYKLRAKGADGSMTILEPDDGPSYVGIETVRHSTTAVCGVGLGAWRADRTNLVAILDEPAKCEVRISRIPGTTAVKVTTTKECNPDLCGNGSSFDGQWVRTAK